MPKDYGKLSSKCESRIKDEPKCEDNRAVRGYVSCYTFKLVLDDMRKAGGTPSSMRDILSHSTYKQRINEAWSEVRKLCGG